MSILNSDIVIPALNPLEFREVGIGNQEIHYPESLDYVQKFAPTDPIHLQVRFPSAQLSVQCKNACTGFPLPLSTVNPYSYPNFRTYGDSFTAGYRADGNYGFAYRIKDTLNLNHTNFAVAGGQIVDFAEFGTDIGILASDLAVILPGFNDCANWGNDDADGLRMAAYKTTLKALIASLTIVDADKRRGNNALVVKSGTWSNTAVGGISSLGVNSGMAGDTLTFTTTGDKLYLQYVQQINNTNSFTVHVDGVLKATQVCNALISNGLAISSRFYDAALLRLSGLGAGNHTIVLTVVNTSASDHVYFEWASGAVSTSSNVFVGHPCRENAVGIANMVGTNYDNYTEKCNRAMKVVSQDLINELSADGLNVHFVDVDTYSEQFIDGMEDADGIHPNNEGHRVLTELFLREMGYVNNANFFMQKLNQGNGIVASQFYHDIYIPCSELGYGVIEVSIYNGTDLIGTAQPIEVGDFDDTILITGHNETSNYETVFKPFSAESVFQLRIEGGFMPASTKDVSELRNFTDQFKQSSRTYGMPSFTKTLKIGDHNGIPDWMFEKLIAYGALDVFMIDSTQWIKSGAWETSETEKNTLIVSADFGYTTNRMTQTIDGDIQLTDSFGNSLTDEQNQILIL